MTNAITTATRSIRSSVAEEMQPALMDEYLDAVAQFPEEPLWRDDGDIDWTQLPPDAIRTRRWGERRANPATVTADDVTALRTAMPRFLRVAYEVEEPWELYSNESVATFHNNGVRKLAGFMGSVWRADERRHAAVLKAAWSGVTQQAIWDAQPHVWTARLDGERASRRHLFMRLVAELGAGATHLTFEANSRGSLAMVCRNMAGDEFRHLAVFWAGTKWLLQNHVSARVLRTAWTVALLGLIHGSQRSGLQRPHPEDTVFVGEMVWAMSRMMKSLVAWDRTLTPARLHEVFGERHAA